MSLFKDGVWKIRDTVYTTEDGTVKTVGKSYSKTLNESNDNIHVFYNGSHIDKKLFEYLDQLGLSKYAADGVFYYSGYHVEENKVVKIHFEKEQYIKIPSGLEKFQDIKTFRVSLCNLNVLPDIVFELKNLERLDLSNNKLTVLPNSFNQLNNLKSLILENNKITELPESLFTLPDLEELNIKGNESLLHNCFQNLLRMSDLKILVVTRKEYNKLPDNKKISLKEKGCKILFN